MLFFPEPCIGAGRDQEKIMFASSLFLYVPVNIKRLIPFSAHLQGSNKITWFDIILKSKVNNRIIFCINDIISLFLCKTLPK